MADDLENKPQKNKETKKDEKDAKSIPSDNTESCRKFPQLKLKN